MKSESVALRRIAARCKSGSNVILPAAVLMIAAGAWGFAQEGLRPRRPDQPVPAKPFHIIGNIYYVGQTDTSQPGSDDAAYLITTPGRRGVLPESPQPRAAPAKSR